MSSAGCTTHVAHDEDCAMRAQAGGGWLAWANPQLQVAVLLGMPSCSNQAR